MAEVCWGEFTLPMTEDKPHSKEENYLPYIKRKKRKGPEKLNMSQQSTLAAKKANRVAGYIS